MPKIARMLISLPALVDDEAVETLRREFVEDMTLAEDDFYVEGPFVLVDENDRKYMPAADRDSMWLDMNIWKNYFGEGYERGDGEFFIRCAYWLEDRLPGCRVYYGHDTNDENIGLFDEAARERLRALVARHRQSLNRT